MLISELERYIEEDLGYWDDSCLIAPNVKVRALILTREDGVIAGLEEAEAVFRYFGVKATPTCRDGDIVNGGDVICNIEGGDVAVLRAERLAINFLGKMSGIATFTHRCVERAMGVRVAATRKTTPGFRKYEKKAVIMGGGDPHRFNLSDMILIKDNHRKLMGLEKAIKAAKKASFAKKIEVEVETLEEALTAAKLGVHLILFDNMTPQEIRKCVDALETEGLRENLILEASGGITLETISEYARSGVDIISTSQLTQAPWLDFSLELI